MVTRNMEPVELGTLPVIWGRSGEQVRDPVTTLPSSTIETLRERWKDWHIHTTQRISNHFLLLVKIDNWQLASEQDDKRSIETLREMERLALNMKCVTHNLFFWYII